MNRKSILPFFAAAIVLGLALAGSDVGRNPQAANRQLLVAFFSATGNTKAVAETAATALQGDLFRIVPQQAYTDADLSHDPQARVPLEQSDPRSRPAIRDTVENWEQYRVVLVGYPIWSGVAPRIIQTFADSYDFSGKTVALFCTSGSSGVEDSQQALQASFAPAEIVAATRFEPNATVQDIRAWAVSAGIG